MTKKWKKLEMDISAPANVLVAGVDVFYAREYDSSDLSAGSTKSAILNFKKDITVKTSNDKEWYWRNKAVEQFSNELLQIFYQKPFHIMAVPGSKPWTHAENNQRFQDLFSLMQKKQNNLIVHWPIDAIQAVPSSAKDHATRNWEEIKANYKWLGFNGVVPEKLIIIDDVLTTGAHFRATVEFLRENKFTGALKGVFWAKTK